MSIRKATLIVLAWNHWELTRRCLETLRATELPDAEILVVDNGSRDETPAELQRIRGIRVITLPENQGFVRGNNAGIAAASPDSDIVLLNNDLEFHQRDWLERLRRCAHSADDIGVVGSRLTLPDGRLLFGMRGGTGLAPADTARMQALIRADFAAMFPALAAVEAPFFWSGLACLTRDLAAYVGPVPGLAGAFAAFGYHGSGVAMASWCGARVADLLAGTLRPADLPPLLARPPRRYPLSGLRRHYLKPAYAWHGWRDG